MFPLSLHVSTSIINGSYIWNQSHWNNGWNYQFLQGMFAQSLHCMLSSSSWPPGYVYVPSSPTGFGASHWMSTGSSEILHRPATSSLWPVSGAYDANMFNIRWNISDCYFVIFCSGTACTQFATCELGESRCTGIASTSLTSATLLMFVEEALLFEHM